MGLGVGGVEWGEHVCGVKCAVGYEAQAVQLTKLQHDLGCGAHLRLDI